jgi:LuxR family glucitol operon transcriptional activator
MEVLGVIAGIAAFFYMAFIGQKTLKEWWRERNQNTKTPVPQVSEETPTPIYHNLPQPDYGLFIGRETELSQVIRQLRPYPHSQHPIVTIDGVGGVGKSALALEVAHRYLRGREDILPGEKFDAVIWTSAKQNVLTAEGIAPRKQVLRTIDDVYTTIAVTLEREDIIKAPAEDQSELIRKALTQQRTLLIIDNLETVDDQAVLEFLRELPAPTKAIVTTRHRIDVAYSIRLHGMPEADALKLIEKECEKKNVTLKIDESEKLFHRTGGVPLALVWSIAQMGLGYGIDNVLANLGQPNSDIARFCFDSAVERIKETEAYSLLLALSFFATDANRNALGQTAGLGRDILGRDEGLVLLEKLSLINKKESRFSLLPVTKTYVLGELTKNPELEGTLGRQWIEYFKSLFANPEDAYYWRWFSYEFVEEGSNIVAAIDWAFAKAEAEDVLTLTYEAIWYLEVAGRWTELYSLVQRSLQLARSINNRKAIARFLGDLGWLDQQRGKYDEAEGKFKEGHRIYVEIKSQEGEGIALQWLSIVNRKRKNFHESKRLCEEALQIALKLQSGDLEALINTERGKLYRDMNDWEESWKIFSKVKDWFESRVAETPRDESVAVGTWGQLGLVAYHLGRYEETRTLCLRSLEFFGKKGSRGYMATLKYRLALAEEALGNRKEALKHAEEAVHWFERLEIRPDVDEAKRFLFKLQGKKFK